MLFVKHNSQLDLYDVKDGRFAVNAFVKAKDSGLIRYITKKHDSYRFEDDGKISECSPSKYCHYEDYEMI